jgi:hypothetical protein
MNDSDIEFYLIATLNGSFLSDLTSNNLIPHPKFLSISFRDISKCLILNLDKTTASLFALYILLLTIVIIYGNGSGLRFLPCYNFYCKSKSSSVNIKFCLLVEYDLGIDDILIGFPLILISLLAYICIFFENSFLGS